MTKKTQASGSGPSDPLDAFRRELHQPPADIAVILAQVAATSGVDLNLLKAFAFVESRFKAGAVNNVNPNNPSMGLFQIRPIPWLNYLKLGSNRDVLLQPLINAHAAADIIIYFEERGYPMPAAADVYNLGEPEYDTGRRNRDYQAKIVTAYEFFKSQR